MNEKIWPSSVYLCSDLFYVLYKLNLYEHTSVKNLVKYGNYWGQK